MSDSLYFVRVQSQATTFQEHEEDGSFSPIPKPFSLESIRDGFVRLVVGDETVCMTLESLQSAIDACKAGWEEGIVNEEPEEAETEELPE